MNTSYAPLLDLIREMRAKLSDAIDLKRPVESLQTEADALNALVAHLKSQPQNRQQRQFLLDKIETLQSIVEDKLDLNDLTFEQWDVIQVMAIDWLFRSYREQIETACDDINREIDDRR